MKFLLRKTALFDSTKNLNQRKYQAKPGIFFGRDARLAEALAKRAGNPFCSDKKPGRYTQHAPNSRMLSASLSRALRFPSLPIHEETAAKMLLFLHGRDAGNRTRSTRTRSVCTTGILHPAF